MVQLDLENVLSDPRKREVVEGTLEELQVELAMMSQDT